MYTIALGMTKLGHSVIGPEPRPFSLVSVGLGEPLSLSDVGFSIGGVE